MQYEPLPLSADLAVLGAKLGTRLSFVRRIDGGQSATTDILMLDDDTKIVLRRHGRWSIGFDDEIASREDLVLRTVRTAGVPTPPVLWSGRFGEGTAIVTEFVAGAPVLRPDDSMRWADQLADTLARIHSVRSNVTLTEALHAAPPSPVDMEPPADLLAHPDGGALFTARAELAPTVAVASFTHGDYWPGNLLWHRDAVVAVLDWEAAVLADPVSDVAYCYAELRYLGLDAAADQFVARYRDMTGSDLASFSYWIVTALCRAVPEVHTYVDGWSGLGHIEDLGTVRRRLNDLVAETLDG